MTKPDGLIIGVDGGGTKTDICIARADGTIVARRKLGGMNPNAIGVEAACKRLVDEMTQITRGVGHVCALYAGVAGAANPAVGARLAARLRCAFPAASRIEVQSDAFNALNGEIGRSDGIAMIAGTGAAAFIRKGEAVTQVGGWGYLIDDAGSGYALGRACLRAAFRAFDGRGEQTALLSLVEEVLKMPLASAIPSIYEGGVPCVASFAQVALKAAKGGDAIAAGLVKTCADDIARHITVCFDRFGAGRAVCVLSGGLVRDEMLFKLVRTQAAGRDVRRARIDPVYGTLVAAAALCGCAADAGFRKNYERTVTER